MLNRFSEPLPWSWQHVLNWGGLRGGVSLALVLSLPATIGADRELLRVMAFVVVLFTLIDQGSTMRLLLKRLGLVTRNGTALDHERHHARLTALRYAERRLEDMPNEGLLSTPTWEQLKLSLAQQIVDLTCQVREALRANPELQAEDLRTAQHELLRAQRSTLMSLQTGGVISDQVFQELSAEIDVELAANSGVNSSDEEGSEHMASGGVNEPEEPNE